MVDNLTWAEMTTKLGLHHQPMLSNVAVTISFSVVGTKHQPIAALMEIPTAFPTWVLLTRRRSRQEIPSLAVVGRPTWH